MKHYKGHAGKKIQCLKLLAQINYNKDQTLDKKINANNKLSIYCK